MIKVFIIVNNTSVLLIFGFGNIFVCCVYLTSPRLLGVLLTAWCPCIYLLVLAYLQDDLKSLAANLCKSKRWLYQRSMSSLLFIDTDLFLKVAATFSSWLIYIHNWHFARYVLIDLMFTYYPSDRYSCFNFSMIITYFSRSQPNSEISLAGYLKKPCRQSD